MMENREPFDVHTLLSRYPGPALCVAALVLVLTLFLCLRAMGKRRRWKRGRTVEAELEQIDRMEGHTFEFWCAGLLEDLGFERVTVTRGSGDQGVDITAEKDEVRFAFQCKCYQYDLGNAPVQEVYTGKTIYRCHVGVVMTNSYFTRSAVTAAEATGVLLWDRDKIADMIALRNQE